ncbi:hypothetical protein BLX88_02770 [Bacillus obstructivus]|uniref:Uncharacterized protein n=1 Tax=Heyndrickxia oleronia TaxID=38875 RepID=A0A8E2I7K0_9BACI|nr:hypothetical protein BLX88_02770 [Bacillus obstructivus]OOP66328.1 hypothetical protein BWZ43_21595 [Heyndrickxia oleronia]
MCRVTKEQDWLPRSEKMVVQGNQNASLINVKEKNTDPYRCLLSFHEDRTENCVKTSGILY